MNLQRKAPMELQNPIFQSSDLSLHNASDSQIHCPSDSLSLPSEPPEIANWFPSYQYSSPITGMSDIFGDSVCEDSEIGKEKLCSNGIEREKEEESLRWLNELETNKFIINNDKIEQQRRSENVDSSCLDSLHSEPIDVRNWFSSYVYESPALDTSDGFRDSVDKESKRDGDESDVEERIRETKGDFPIKRIENDVESSDGRINCNNSFGDNEQEKQSFNKADIRSGAGNGILSDKSNVCFGSALKHGSEYAVFQNHGTSTSEDVMGSNMELEDSPKIYDVIGIMRCSVQKSSEKSRLRKRDEKESGEKGYEEADGFSSPKSNLKPVLINEVSTRKSAGRCKDKENDGEEIANGGFVSTRKGRFSGASEENNHLETRRANIKEEYSATERKALAERTNFHLSSVTEITGKWKCPQSRKPNLGPPLKQLRLERWVRRS